MNGGGSDDLEEFENFQRIEWRGCGIIVGCIVVVIIIYILL
jgi:hypothetical protein